MCVMAKLQVVASGCFWLQKTPEIPQFACMGSSIVRNIPRISYLGHAKAKIARLPPPDLARVIDL